MPDEHAGLTDTSVAVSVIVPFYNAVDYLEECINSVLEQDVEAVVELLLIDDCSTDGGDCLAERIFAGAGADRRCVLVRQPRNAGTSTARNTGVEMSRGRYVLFLDADDKLLPGALRVMLQAAEEQHADMVIGDVECRTGKYGDYFHPRCLGVLEGEDAFAAQMRHDVYATVWNRLIRREYLENPPLRFEAGIYHEDALYCFLLHARFGRTVVIPDTTYYYRTEVPGSRDTVYTVQHVIDSFIVAKGEVACAQKNHLSEREDVVRHITMLLQTTLDYKLRISKPGWRQVWYAAGRIVPLLEPDMLNLMLRAPQPIVRRVGKLCRMVPPRLRRPVLWACLMYLK